MTTTIDLAPVTASDRQCLRDLATRLRERAADPIQARRIDLWRHHNSLRRPARPVIYLSPEGSWREIVPADTLVCEDPLLRAWERSLRQALHQDEHFHDDIPCQAHFDIHQIMGHTGWGLEPRRVPSPTEHGAWCFDPVVDGPADLARLRQPDLTWDEATSQAQFALAQDCFGDLLDVRLRGQTSISFHLMKEWTALRGLETVMMDMYDEPQMTHDALAFLAAGHARLLQQKLDAGLLDHNQDHSYHNSGGRGWTFDLPLPDANPNRPRLADLWGSAEAQEMAQVSPDQHAEFVLPYEKTLLAPFGLTGYGCCEDLTDKLDDVLTIPNLRRISCSPWADVARCCERLGDRHIVSWKPHPVHLAGDWDEARVRGYLRHALDQAQAHGCFFEMILKDTHTCDGHPERFDRWAAIAREEIAAAGYDVDTHPFAA